MQIVQNFSTGKKFSEVRLKNMLDSRIFSLEHSFICVCKFDANLQSTMSPKRSTPQAFGGGMSSTAAPPIRVNGQEMRNMKWKFSRLKYWPLSTETPPYATILVGPLLLRREPVLFAHVSHQGRMNSILILPSHLLFWTLQEYSDQYFI